MLPRLLLTPLIFLVAIAWPIVQSFHALQMKSSEQRAWLLYWLCLLLWCRTSPWYEWLLKLPFYFLDVYEEVQFGVVCFLVLPDTTGMHRLQPAASALATVTYKMAALATVTNKMAASIKGAVGVAQVAQGKLRDRPGSYTIIKQAGVMPSMETLKGHVLHQLNIGDVVEVVEVVHNDKEGRVRARIEAPAGWISLLNMQSGARWAVHADDAQLPQTATLPHANEIFANAAAAGCNPTALFGGLGGGEVGQVSTEDAWEAMAMLESQLARADDFSEDVGTRHASGMLRTMLTTLVQTGNPAMVTMAQAMMPDLGKIWADEGTREYLKDLLTAPAAVASAGSAAPTASGASGTGVGSSSGAGSSGPATASAGNSGGSGGSGGSGAGGSGSSGSMAGGHHGMANGAGSGSSSGAAAMGSGGGSSSS